MPSMLMKFCKFIMHIIVDAQPYFLFVILLSTNFSSKFASFYYGKTLFYEKYEHHQKCKKCKHITMTLIFQNWDFPLSKQLQYEFSRLPKWQHSIISITLSSTILKNPITIVGTCYIKKCCHHSKHHVGSSLQHHFLVIKTSGNIHSFGDQVEFYLFNLFIFEVFVSLGGGMCFIARELHWLL